MTLIVLVYQRLCENLDIKRLGTTCDVARVIQIVFGDYLTIRIVAKNRPIKVVPNTIREYYSNSPIRGEH